MNFAECGGITEYVSAQSAEDAGRLPSEQARNLAILEEQIATLS